MRHKVNNQHFLPSSLFIFSTGYRVRAMKIVFQILVLEIKRLGKDDAGIANILLFKEINSLGMCAERVCLLYFHETVLQYWK